MILFVKVFKHPVSDSMGEKYKILKRAHYVRLATGDYKNLIKTFFINCVDSY